MVKILVFLIGVGSLLLFASTAQGQPSACTRFENGRLYILPGCRGPGASGYEPDVDGTTTGPNATGVSYPDGRRHPFTGEAWGSGMAILSWNRLMALVALGDEPGPPAIVEAPFTMRLKASFQEQTPRGARISRIRITTKDLIEQLAQDFGVSGEQASLVRRREIGELAGEDARLYLVMDGVDYLVEGFIEPLPLSLPEGLYGSASGFKLRRGDGAVTSFESHEVSGFSIGDLAVDGFSMSLLSLDAGRFVWTDLPGPDGLLCKKLTSQVTGGMQLSELPLESPMLVTGTLQVGPEAVVSP